MNLTKEQLQKLGMTQEQVDSVLFMVDANSNLGNVLKEGKPFGGLADNVQKVSSTLSQPTVKQSVIEDVKADVPVNCSEAMTTTSVFDLQKYAKGTLVRFPDFAEGQPFVARVRRPSMLVLAKQGKIPNTLLASANELFSKGGSGMDGDNENMLADIYSICEIICESALKEPTYQQIKDAGLELSDNQLMAIFNYTQVGVKALESFR